MRFSFKFLFRILLIYFLICLFLVFYFFILSFQKKIECFYSPFVNSWSNNVENFIAQEFHLSKTMCHGNFKQYQNKFVILKNVYLDKSRVFGRNGGEMPETVLNQSETLEFLNYKPGFISIPCYRLYKEKIRFLLGKANHLNSYYASLTYYSSNLLNFIPEKLIYDKVVLFITRNEYANFYHSMTDFYITFIICRIFNWNVKNIHVVLTDAHPRSIIDKVWIDLYPNFSRFSNFNIGSNLLIREVVWIPFGYIAPIMQLSWPSAPFLDEFRDYFLTSYGIDYQSKKPPCKFISILFIWRRDYLAHPRNPSGEITRKISNEAELVTELRKAYKTNKFLAQYNIVISEAQLDKYSMKSQLELITNTTILIGMHGAALTHALFLPKNSGLIELFPMYYSENNVHFKSICKWRGLHYEHYVNHSPKNEKSRYKTYFKPIVIIDRVEKILKKMNCSH